MRPKPLRGEGSYVGHSDRDPQVDSGVVPSGGEVEEFTAALDDPERGVRPAQAGGGAIPVLILYSCFVKSVT